MNANYKTLILPIGLFLALTASVSAAPGDLDPVFGNGGIVHESAYQFEAVTIQPDGKIVVASFVGEYPDFDIAVFRYNPDGSRDTTFDGDGRVTTDIGGRDAAHAVALQPDGKILVGANSVNFSESGSSFVVVRYHSDGSLDTTFDGDGKVITDIGGEDAAHSIALQPDGKIVVAGRGQGADGLQEFVVVRYNSNGSLDTSFDGDGIVTTGVNGSRDGAQQSVVVQPDGKIVTSGNGGGLFTVVRYNSDGSLDTSFDGDGKVTTGNGEAKSVVVQPDGKIIATGYWSPHTFVVARYNSNGSPDTTFAGDGTATINVQAGAVANSVVLRPDGKIVVAGSATWGSGFDSSLVVARYNSNGFLDVTFGGDGIVVIGGDNPKENYYSGNAAAVDIQGRIVIAGGFYGAAVYRFLGASRSLAFDFDGDARSDVSVFRPSDSTWYLNRSTQGFSATQFGLSTDKITPADYDGDGQTDISVYRDGTWYWLNSSDNSFNARQFGIASDIPVPADYYAGDGKADLAIYRNGVWWIQNLTNNETQVVNFGLSGDKPVPADFDGDGRTDQAIYRNGEWHLNRSSQGYAVVNFGLATDKPVTGDYDGDGRTDPAVYCDGIWYLLQSSNGFAVFPFGISTDIPAPADYDGDGRTDAAVFRDGVWYLRQTTNGISIRQFGLTNDKPIPAALLP